VAVTVKIEGLKELATALKQLPKATSRNVQRRVLLKRAEPLVATAKALAPVRTARLRDSIIATTKRPKGRKSAAAQAFGKKRGMGGTVAEARAASKEAGESLIEVFVGPGRVRQAIAQEFGWAFGGVFHAPHPYMRQAWDQHKASILAGIGKDMADEIERAANRLAKKRSK
jgi:HK97 gp10 family phage protein